MKNKTKIFIDLDGTISGCSIWKGVLWNTLQLFRTDLLINIPKAVRWSILTCRPRIDMLFIKRVCIKYKLNPDKIIQPSTWLYPFKTFEDSISWKSSILSDRLDYINTNKVIYVDNDLYVLSKIMPQKNLILCTASSLQNILDIEDV